MTTPKRRGRTAHAGPIHADPLRVLIVEDDIFLGTLLQELVEKQSDISLVGVATTAEQALEAARVESPDLVLLDIGLPDRSGLALLTELTGSTPGVRVLMLTLADDMESVLTAFRYGAIGYVPKRQAMQSLVPAIEAARHGDPWIDPQMTLAVLAELRRMSAELELLQGTEARLTPREREVAGLVARGDGDRQIAQRLQLSPNTVRVHIKRIRHKLGLSNRAELAAHLATEAH